MSLATAHAFEVSWLRRVATSVETCPVGTVVLTGPAPRIRDHNAVVLDPGSPTADAVRSATDAAMAAAGLPHRREYAHDPAQADLLAVDGAMAGSVRVFSGDGVAQVEELDVLDTYGGRGIGRRLLAEAATLAGGHHLVFLTCDPDDWTAGWYRRLGFTPLGRQAGFLRPEPE